MGWLSARSGAVAVAVFAVCGLLVPALRADAPKAEPASRAAAAVRAAPTRPTKLWEFSKLRGVDYVSIRDIAENFKLKLAWTKAGETLTLSDARGVRFNFENNQRDFYFDGMRIFLGAPVLSAKNGLWVSRLDLIKIVAPLYRPIDYVSHLPEKAPRLIVIDPGHGGIDPGTENTSLKINEKTFALDVALRLKKLLELNGWQVVLTRTKDKELSRSKKVDLAMRAQLANTQKADVFLTIHFNAAQLSVSGIETYVLPAQTMLSSGSERKDELTDQAFPNNRFDYANLLLGHELHAAMLKYLKTSDRGYKRARWGVLRPVECPAVLVECAYLSNAVEARRVMTPEFRQKIAESLAEGLRDYSATLAFLRPAQGK